MAEERSPVLLKCCTLNVRGLHNSAKRTKLFEWILDNNYDIAFLQETYCTQKLLPYFKSTWKGEDVHSLTDSDHSRGTCILFNPKLKVNIIGNHASEDGRLLLVNAEIDSLQCSLLSVYAPNSQSKRKAFFVKMRKWINKYAMFENKIVAGDTNCSLRDIDRSPQTHLNDKSRTTLKGVLNSCNLFDVWNYKNVDNPGYTFEDRNSGTKSRLDYVFVDGNMLYNVKEIGLCKCPFVPDHLTVYMHYMKSECERGGGYWKMNSSILKNEDFRLKMVEEVKKTEEEYKDLAPKVIWELIKIKIKQVSIQYSQKLKKRSKTNKLQLQKKLDQLTMIHGINKTEEMAEIERDLDNIYSDEIKGAQIRAKAKWVEEGERCNKYFLNLEKKQQISNVINILKDENGHEISDSHELLEECCNFYNKLYTSQSIPDKNIDEYLSSINIPSLSMSDKVVCEDDITEKEIYEAVKNLKNGKSPGTDGIVPEFYKEYWNILKLPFMRMLTDIFKTGELPSSMRNAIITLIHKKGDKQLLSNYRPISLTKYDYKIIAFVLAMRIQGVINKLIHKDQSGYIKGRFIGQNARLISDIFEYCEKYNIKGAIINLDFEKAFDRLEWNFLFKTLCKFNFGCNFIKWIQILYRDPKIIIKNNGWMSKSLSISRGIRQGCPVSSLLFILAIEIMSVTIRKFNDEKIEGFNFGNNTHKVSQYADDSTLLLSNDVALVFALQCVDRFCAVSGMKLNIDKTEGIWMGPYKTNPSWFQGIRFTQNPVRCLGIYIGHDVEACYRENWISKINKLKNSLHIWKSRKLTIIGRILIVKTIALSKLIYSFTVLSVPDEVIRLINKCVYMSLYGIKKIELSVKQ